MVTVAFSGNISLHIFHEKGRLAQLVEHWSNKPRVAGSSPVVTTFCFWIEQKFGISILHKKQKTPSRGIEPRASA
jgi:hypothetical protein